MSAEAHWTVETTFPGAAFGPKARAFALDLVKRRLSACVHVEAIRSLYWWNGKVEQGGEVKLSFKTSRGRVDELVAAIRRLHPYEVPYIAAFPIEVKEKSYAAWLEKETSPQP